MYSEAWTKDIALLHLLASGSYQTEQLTAAVSNTNVDIALLAYDILITIEGEVIYVWNQEFSAVTVIFLNLRYITLISQSVYVAWCIQPGVLLVSKVPLETTNDTGTKHTSQPCVTLNLAHDDTSDYSDLDVQSQGMFCTQPPSGRRLHLQECVPTTSSQPYLHF